jgi:exopolysaccharide biosynthesis polyprenyl glycosylphosphotransferase
MDLFTRLYQLKIVAFIKKWRLVNIILGFFDILSIAVAFQCAYLINLVYQLGDGFFFFSNRDLLKLFIVIIPVWLVVLYFMQVTEIPRTKRYRTLFVEYMLSALVVALFLLIFYFIFSEFKISRRFLVEFVFLGFFLLFYVRLAEYRFSQTYRAKGFNFINIAVIADESSQEFIQRLRFTPMWGYRITIIFSDSGKINEIYRGVYEVLPYKSTDVLQNLIASDIIDEVLYIKNKIIPSEVRKTIRVCEEFGVVFRLMTKDKQPGLTNAFVTVLAHEKFLTFSNIPFKPFALGIKKFMDMGISIVLLLCLSPIFLFIGLLIFLTSKGPVIYSQERVGLRGRPFLMYKFRTMIVNANEIRQELNSKNEMDGPVFKIKNDPRITRVGRFLRRTGLDELPQLFNIIKGEMSLIGPRPPLKEETAQYKNWQLRRLSIKPGLSCFWQVKPGRNNIKFEKWMEMDLAYIDNWSLRLDFMILIKTIRTVFQRSGT